MATLHRRIVWAGVLLIGCQSASEAPVAADSETSGSMNWATVSGCSLDADQAATTNDTDWAPLECISWERDGAVLHLTISNLHGGCVSDFSATVTQDGDRVQVLLLGSCDSAPCGWCHHDFSIPIGVTGTPSQLELIEKECGTQEVSTAHGIVALESAAGTACRYDFPPAAAATASGVDRGSCGPADAAACPGAAQCESAPYPESPIVGQVCKPVCSTNADCLSVESCIEGLCELEQTW